MSTMQLSLFADSKQYPDKAKQNGFWYHERQQWVCCCEGKLEPFSHAGIAGFPAQSQLSPGFGRYVCLEADGTFNLRKAKDPTYQKYMSHLYFGEDSAQPRITGLW